MNTIPEHQDRKGARRIFPFACIAVVCALLIGCATPETTAYRAVKSTEITATAAMTAWGDYVAQNHPGIQAEQTVKTAYDKYRVTMLAVADAGSLYSTLKTESAEQQLNAALAQSATALTDLIALLQTLGVRLASK